MRRSKTSVRSPKPCCAIRGGRLVELAADRQRLGLQPARSNQPAERPTAPARVVVGDGRHGRAGSDAARLQRRHVSAEPGGVIQALDAATGDLIWEYRPEADRSPASHEAPLAVAAASRRPSRAFRNDRGRAAAGGGDTERGIQRNVAIFGDKIFGTTNDAHIVALDARTGKVRLGHDGRRFQAGLRLHIRPDRRPRQGDRGDHRMQPLQGGCLLHHRARCGDRKGVVAHVHGCAAGRAGRRDLGRPAARRSAPAATRGSPAATIPTPTSSTGAPRRRSRGRAPFAAPTATRSTRTRRSRSIPTPAR